MTRNVDEVNDTLEWFRATVAWQNRILALFGCYMYSGPHRLSARIAFIGFIAVAFIVLSLYSAVRSWGNMSEMVWSIAAIFYAIVGVARLAVAIGNPDGCLHSMRLTEQAYLNADRSRPVEQCVLAKYTRLFCHSVTVYTSCFLFSIVMVTLLTFGFYLFLGQMFLPLGVSLPFVDSETPAGYWTTLAAQLVFIFVGPMALIPSQNIYFAFIFNICMQYELLIARLDDLDVTIRSASQAGTDSCAAGTTVREKLVEIIQFQQSCTNFIVHIEKLYHLQSFVEFLCHSLQVAVTLSELHRTFWLPGLFIMPVAILQMLILCFLGTLIELRSDQLIEKLYDVAWSEMRCQEQAMFKFVLKKAQQPTQLTCGGLAVINMNLFMLMLKKIYSFFMMLQNV